MYSYTDNHGERIEEKQYLFFNTIKNDKIKGRPSVITIDELNWFNRQASTWPIHHLVIEAIFLSSQLIASFIVTNNQKIQQIKGAYNETDCIFDNILHWNCYSSKC